MMRSRTALMEPMPTLLRAGPFRFSMVMGDCVEPRHVHVTGAGGSAKLWLEPVSVDRVAGYSRHQMRLIERLVVQHATTLIDRWDEECRRLG
jgi:hypothetical protein